MTLPSSFATKSVGDKLASADANTLNSTIQSALDKRAGQTDTLGCIVSASGAGRLIPTTVDGANADTTYGVTAGNAVIRVTSAVTANRTYTFDNTSAITGDTIDIYCDATFVTFNVTIKSAAAVTLFTLGNAASSTGTWAKFRFAGGVWTLFESAGVAPPRMQSQVFTSSGTFTVPSTVTQVEVHGMGGGGGGGGAGGTPTGLRPISGGGGGGGKLGIVNLTGLTPGGSITVTIGAGGTAGSGGTSALDGNDGGDGGDTSFGALATFYGAMGGQRGLVGISSGTPRSVLGGQPIRSTAARVAPRAFTAGKIPAPGEGGMGFNNYTTTDTSVLERTGGSTFIALGGGTPTVTSYGAGGGGGASEWPGNVAGVGGVDTSASPGGNGTAGTIGAGGGGGGCGGYAGGAATGGSGGAGGPGALIVVWVA